MTVRGGELSGASFPGTGHVDASRDRAAQLTCLAGRSRATPQSPLGVALLFNKKHPRRWVGRVRDNGPREVALCSESY